MQHSIPVKTLAPMGEEMARAVEKCVHCGFCLPVCPTYNLLSVEMDSPRGRIILMKSVLEGTVDLEDALPYIDRCLGCLSCVSACPSGVSYGDLFMPFRAFAKEQRRTPFVDRAAHRLIMETLPYPSRFRLAARVGKIAEPIKGVLPHQFQSMIALIPSSIPETKPLPDFFPAGGKIRARVALLAGCVQQAIAPEINWATLRVLARNGVEVVIPSKQGCCGALAIHTGDLGFARVLAAHNICTFPSDVDAVVTNAAGCGSGMHEYPLLFKGTDMEDEAREFSSRVHDIAEFLHDLGIEDPPALSKSIKIAYQDACHLAHAQGIMKEPRHLLEQIPNLTILPIPESEICCGSAGIYNLEHPETADELGRRKASNIKETGVEGVVTGNIGCLVQLRSSLAEMGLNLPVWHTIEMLDYAYRGLN